MAKEREIRTFANYQEWLDDRNRTMKEFTKNLQNGQPIDELSRQLAESDKALQKMKEEGVVK